MQLNCDEIVVLPINMNATLLIKSPFVNIRNAQTPANVAAANLVPDRF